MNEPLRPTIDHHDGWRDIQQAGSWSDVYHALSRVAIDLDIRHFAVLLSSAPSDPRPKITLVSNWPRTWIDRYFPHVSTHREPILAALGTSTGTLLWDSVTRTQDTVTFFAYAAHEGLENAITAQVYLSTGARLNLTFSGAAGSPSQPNGSTLQRDVLWYASAIASKADHLTRFAAAPAHNPLSNREQQISYLVARGHSNREISGHFQISDRTTIYHLASVAAKLETRGRKGVVPTISATGQLQTIHQEQGFALVPPAFEIVDTPHIQRIGTSRQKSQSAKDPAPRLQPTLPFQQPTPQSLVVLIVDDEAVSSTVLKNLLLAHNITRIYVAQSAHDALPIAKQLGNQLDLLFLDLNMPEVDGLSAATLLAPWTSPTLVPVTAHGPRIARAASTFARALGFSTSTPLCKPFDPTLIEQIVQERIRYLASKHNRRRSLSHREVSDAIAQGRVEVHYQPKISITTGRLAGIEALARLRDQNGALVYPAQFLAQAESDPRIINQLTESVARTAIRDLKTLRENLDLTLSFNLSYFANGKSEQFTDTVIHLAQDAGQSPSNIIIEVTETDLNSHPQLILIAVRMRLAGFGLSMDDFGVKGSDIPRLQQIPFTEIKIDRSLVSHADNDPDARAILSSVTSLARRLSMHVVAEGVETAQCLNVLRDTHCDEAQGFLFSPGLPMDQLTQFIPNWGLRSDEMFSKLH